jgi:uncharacterized protein (DUF169 family)
LKQRFADLPEERTSGYNESAPFGGDEAKGSFGLGYPLKSKEVSFMKTLSELNQWGEELEARLQLRTSPLAIKMLERKEDIPEGAMRPLKDTGQHLDLCQAFAKSRREKATVAMLKEDHWCYVPVIALGLAEPPDFFLEGHADFPSKVADLETAKNLAKTFPRLKVGKYIGIVSAPLKKASFQPDLVAVYCNSAQLRCLLTGLKYRKGYMVTSTMDPGGACVQCTVPVLLDGECQVTVPCGGDRKRALAQDDELIFSLPTEKMDDLIAGLTHFDETGAGYLQFAPDMKAEHPLPQLYVKVGKLLGMDIHE